METQDKENTKKKAFVISSLMNNPKLAQSLFESWEAPVGSTKNTKAKSILYSMKRANNIHDQNMTPVEGSAPRYAHSTGFGSVQDILDAQQEPKWKTPNYRQGRGIIRGVDDLIKWSESPTSKEDGKTRLDVGAGSIGKAITRSPSRAGEAINWLESDVMYPWMNLMSAAGQNLLSFPGRTKDYLTDPEWGEFEKGKSYTLDPARDGIAGKTFPLYGKNTFPSPSITVPKKKYYKFKGADKVYNSKTHEHITEKQAEKIPDFWDNVEEISDFSLSGKSLFPTEEEAKMSFADRSRVAIPGMSYATQRKTSVEDSTTKYKDLLMAGVDPTTAAYEVKWQTGFDPDVEAVNKDLEKNPNYNPNFGIETFRNNPEDADDIFNAMDPSMQDFWRGSYEASSIFGIAEDAIELGLGSEWYVNKVLGDKKLLGSMLGLSEDQSATLPEGMLQEQLFDLRDSLKNEYRIDEQRDELYKLQQRDLDINDKFITYIHNKDEYLDEISELLKGTEKRIASMDTSNPYVAKRMQSYVNYLTILQGRQNQRYIDFLDSGIQHHKNQMDSLTLNINRDIEGFNEEWPEIKAIRTEHYNTMTNMLEGIFNNIESRGEQQRDLEEWEWKKVAASDTHLKMVLGNAKLNAEILGGGTGKEVNASTAKMFTGMYSAGENDDGTLNFTTYNPYEVMNQANTAGQNSEYAMNSFMKDMGYTISKSVGTGSLDQFEKFRDSMTKNISNNIVNMDNLSKVEQEAYDNLSSEEQEAFKKIQESLIVDENRMYSKLENNLQAGLKEYFSSTEEKIKELREAINDLNYNRGIGGWRELAGTIKKPKREDFIKDHSNIQGKLVGALFDYTMQTVTNGNLSGPRDVWGDVPGDNLPEIVSKEITPYLML